MPGQKKSHETRTEAVPAGHTSGYDLSTFSGIMTLSNGISIQEWDYWKKVSDSSTYQLSQLTGGKQTQNSSAQHGGLFTGIGRMLSPVK